MALKLEKYPNEDSDSLIKRFRRAVVDEGIIRDYRNTLEFRNTREKKEQKKKQRILHY